MAAGGSLLLGRPRIAGGIGAVALGAALLTAALGSRSGSASSSSAAGAARAFMPVGPPPEAPAIPVAEPAIAGYDATLNGSMHATVSTITTESCWDENDGEWLQTERLRTHDVRAEIDLASVEREGAPTSQRIADLVVPANAGRVIVRLGDAGFAAVRVNDGTWSDAFAGIDLPPKRGYGDDRHTSIWGDVKHVQLDAPAKEFVVGVVTSELGTTGRLERGTDWAPYGEQR